MLQLLLNQRGYNATGSNLFRRTGTGFVDGGDAYSNELFEQIGRLRPPQPNGDLGGYSFKFTQEFKTALGGNASPKDVCFL